VSIAWSTVVVVVLLIPGFCFFAGFYAPEAMTRETVTPSPFTQLAAIVLFSFATHLVAYVLINPPFGLCTYTCVPCVDLDLLSNILRADLSRHTTAPIVGSEAMPLTPALNRSAPWALVYFATTGIAMFVAGFLTGTKTIQGKLPLAKHRHLLMLETGVWTPRKTMAKSTRTQRFVRAHVLSKTADDDLVLMYDGILASFYSNADGTLSYLVLRGARRGSIRIDAGETKRAGKAVQLSGDTYNARSASTSLLYLPGDEIANVYFEELQEFEASEDDVANLAKDIADAAAQSPAETLDGG
jgi:hypothetical protein